MAYLRSEALCSSDTDMNVAPLHIIFLQKPSLNFLIFLTMAPSAIIIEDTFVTSFSEIATLRKALTSETVHLARRFRALFSLKHHACLHPPTELTIPAIHAIASAFSSPSALVKHELAYCLGQTRNMAAVPFLRRVLEDLEEDPMCRHEAAEALGALGDEGSLEILGRMRDDAGERDVVRETCEIAVERIEWEHSGKGNSEKLKNRFENLYIIGEPE